MSDTYKNYAFISKADENKVIADFKEKKIDFESIPINGEDNIFSFGKNCR